MQCQSWTEYELIIVDDHSEPPLAETADRVLAGAGRIIRATGYGAAAARNDGIRAASGDYIAFLDSDDVFLPCKLERAAEHLEETPGAVIYSRVWMDFGDGVGEVRPARAMTAGEALPDYLFASGALIATPSLVVPRRLAVAVGWNETLGYGDDSDFVIRLWLQGATFRFVPEVLVHCDAHHRGPRLSTCGSVQELERWLTAMTPHMGRRAVLNYRATHLVALRGLPGLGRSIADIILAGLVGGLKPSAAARSLARGIIPGKIFRHLRRWACRLRHAGGRQKPKLIQTP